MQLADKAMFLELEQESDRPLNVMRQLPSTYNVPARSSFQGSRRRSGRVARAKHRRSWSVGGSNVHQMMMRRSRSPLNRLEFAAEKAAENKTRNRDSTATLDTDRSVECSSRCSVLVDAETQTESALADAAVIQRSKGDGFCADSPLMRNRYPRDSNVLGKWRNFLNISSGGINEFVNPHRRNIRDDEQQQQQWRRKQQRNGWRQWKWRFRQRKLDLRVGAEARKGQRKQPEILTRWTLFTQSTTDDWKALHFRRQSVDLQRILVQENRPVIRQARDSAQRIRS